MEQLSELYELGRGALAAGQWQEAERALADVDPPSVEALELLAESVWWQRRPTDAIAAWSRAAELSHESGEMDDAVRLAAWVGREYLALGSGSVAAGWLSRASGWADAIKDEGGSGAAWLGLAEALAQSSGAEQALAVATRTGDQDLQVLASAAWGLEQIRAGEIGEGLRCFDTALATATGGGLSRLRTFGELCCDFVLATELTGDIERFAEWSEVVTDFVERHGFPSVMGFCTTCCAELETSRGDWDAVEQQLRAAVVGLHDEAYAARCLPPDAKLARLLVLQGRYEEAELLAENSPGDAGMLALASLALARGDLATTVALTERVGRSLAKDPSQEVDALAMRATALAQQGRHAEANECVRKLDAVVENTSPRAQALAALTRGRVAYAAADVDAARAALERAVDHASGVRGSVEAAEAHFLLAQISADDPDLARTEARAALRSFEAANATQRADEAAALLRDLGDRSRVGAKGAASLTNREQDVLRLVAAGLTNAEIAERLVISQKTAGNHVSSILTKLNVRSRTEAALYYLAPVD
ncbi:MAG TPA: LuxR C-terminal-related transcriptional regulator [Actinomycetes bacterium]|nr:LuxR C-terminal-related transcriptional regulator [Actinomycetes bacterium]